MRQMVFYTIHCFLVYFEQIGMKIDVFCFEIFTNNLSTIDASDLSRNIFEILLWTIILHIWFVICCFFVIVAINAEIIAMQVLAQR